MATEFANVTETVTDALFGLPDFSFFSTLAKTVGIVFLIYLLILIVQALVRIKQALRLRSIDKNIMEINKKLDLIIHRAKKK